MERRLTLSTLQDMQELATVIASAIEPTDTLTLRGELGVGKTELARAVIRRLMGAEETVPSPTFTLVQTYETPRGTVNHFDLYRLEHPEDVHELGFDEAIAHSITLIEWPEKIRIRSYKNHLDIHLEIKGETEERQVTLIGTDHWEDFFSNWAGLG